MGYIYRILNTINDKCYIGQTIKPYEQRFLQHKLNYTKPYFSQLALYKAFKKYGIENFLFQVIEEIENDKLDEREKYWIQYYNSYYNGYNSTLGGKLVQLYDWDIDYIIELYQQLRSARKVAKKIGCDHSTIDDILNQNKIPRFSTSQQQRVNVTIDNGSIKETFLSFLDCAQFLIEHNYTKSNKPKNVCQGLRDAYNNNRPYFGFNIYCENKI